MVAGPTKRPATNPRPYRHAPGPLVPGEGTYEAIIDRETFETVQRNLDIRSGRTAPAWCNLAGLVKCMDCGSTMSKTSNGKKERTVLSAL